MIGLLCLYGLWFTNAATQRQTSLGDREVEPAAQSIAAGLNSGHATVPHATVERAAPVHERHVEVSESQPAVPATKAVLPSSCKPGIAGGANWAGDFDGESHLALRTLKSFDSHEMSVSGWIFVDKPHDGQVMSMHTIVSNKFSGCLADTSHNGFSIFVNECG